MYEWMTGWGTWIPFCVMSGLFLHNSNYSWSPNPKARYRQALYRSDLWQVDQSFWVNQYLAAIEQSVKEMKYKPSFFFTTGSSWHIYSQHKFGSQRRDKVVDDALRTKLDLQSLLAKIQPELRTTSQAAACHINWMNSQAKWPPRPVDCWLRFPIEKKALIMRHQMGEVLGTLCSQSIEWRIASKTLLAKRGRGGA